MSTPRMPRHIFASQDSPSTAYSRSGGALTALLALLAVVGCASAPRNPAVLDDARASVAAAHADSTVKGDANLEMAKADAALTRASAAWAQGDSTGRVDHDAYLAGRYARAAQAHGSLLAAQGEIAQQDARRNAVLLEARTADATRAADQARDSAAGLAIANDRAAGLAADLAELKAKQTDRGTVVTLGDVLFATGKSTLQRGSSRAIDVLSMFLMAHPERQVRIEGFTDSVGAEAYNQGLSEQRAEAVAQALARNGVAQDRVLSQGYGEAYPVGDNATATGRQQNRRVEVIISNADSAVVGRLR